MWKSAMRPRLNHPVFPLVEKLRSAVRTGRKLHLSLEEVRVLLRDEIYQPIARLEAEEMRKACDALHTNDNNSETSGSGSALTPAPGVFAGSNVVPMDAASRGARQLLQEEAELMRRRKKLKTR